MTARIKQAQRVFSRQEYRAARFDLACRTILELFREVPDAGFIEITVSRLYDDSIPEMTTADFEAGPPMALWLKDDDPREQYPEWTGCTNQGSP